MGAATVMDGLEQALVEAGDTAVRQDLRRFASYAGEYRRALVEQGIPEHIVNEAMKLYLATNCPYMGQRIS